MMIIKQELGDSPMSNVVGPGRMSAMARGGRRGMDAGEGGGMLHEMEQQDGDTEAQDEADDEDKYRFMGVIEDVSRLAGDQSATNVEDQLSYDNSASDSPSMTAHTPKSRLQPQRRLPGKAHPDYGQGSGSNLRME